MNDLDFDTNGNGVLSDEAYWNAGAGWAPLVQVVGIFEGNGHRIRNLYINRPGENYVGLVGQGNGAYFRNLTLDGNLMSITGGSFTGALVGLAIDGEILGCHAGGSVVADDPTSAVAGGLAGSTFGAGGDFPVRKSSFSGTVSSTGGNYASAGGLTGEATNTTIERSYSSGEVDVGCGDTCRIGGLVGFGDPVIFTNAYSQANLSGTGGAVVYIGGLAGEANATIDNSYAATGMSATASFAVVAGGLLGEFRTTAASVDSSYWDADVSGMSGSSGGGIGLTTTEMQCPVAGGDTACKPGTIIYDGWLSTAWNFGAAGEYPSLYMNDRPTADAGGPYVLAEGDALVLNGSASADADGSIVGYAWDLDNDGQYDDASGVSVALGAQPDDADRVVGLRVTDNAGATATTTASITVNNVAPTAHDVAVTVVAGKNVQIDLAGTDAGAGDTFSYQVVVAPGKGSLSGSGPLVDYRSNGQVGSDSFSYEIIDDDGGVSGTAVVTITVTAAPHRGGKSGGGSLPVVVLAWMALLLLRVRR
ncbi:MAG: Ig-like domain-containing protein [Pseudomonadota bacterium]